MHHFSYRAGVLHAEGVAIPQIAAEVGTPFYCYSAATLTRHYRVFTDALKGLDARVCFAVKANTNLAVIRTLVALGAGCDVVSGGELKIALKAGCPPEKIVFSGVGKTEAELRLALTCDVGQINVESEAVAVAVHIGSQITSLAPFEAAFVRVRDLVIMLRADGFAIDHLDLGGGLGVPYDHTSNTTPPSPEDYGQMVKCAVGDLNCKITFEPGRLLVGNAGIMVSEVVSIKDSTTRRFVIVDAGMNDLVRPAMYGARHDIIPIKETPASAELTSADVVGPVCETTDCFAKGVNLPPLKAGDLVAFLTAGAYGAVMASTYNARPLIPEVMVSGDEYAIVRRRPTFDEMVALEALPPWIA